MRILDSRRLTGPNLLLDGPGAILDVATAEAEGAAVVDAWRAHLGEMLEAVGWRGEQVASRLFSGGCSLAFAAPFDALYAATEINEWALEAVGSPAASARQGFDAARVRLRDTIDRERNPALVALAKAADARGVTFLSDTKRVSVGLGVGSRSWPLRSIPVTPDRIRWAGLHDIDVALVTGTNGKTTTVRLLGAMARAAGRISGTTSTDCVQVGDETVAVGDYSGPNGGRTVLRDRRVEMAFLEVARGGILRRGLPVRHAQTALVTNVASDHMGEYGIFDLDSLADAKLVVAKAIGPEGRVVLNADDPRLLDRGQRLGQPVTWFTRDARHPVVASHIARGGDASVLEEDALVLHRRRDRHAIARVSDVPIAFGGAAGHNVANALGAIGVAGALDLPFEAIGAGLTRFESSPAANPGRANQWIVNGTRVIVDYAHNPHGLEALIEMTRALDARRRALVIGQAGDRDDAAISEFVRVAWAMRPDHVFIKEMVRMLRGREAGAVPLIMEREFRRMGAQDGSLSRHDSELHAVRAALAWARPGDLLLLTVHSERDQVIELLDTLAGAAETT